MKRHGAWAIALAVLTVVLLALFVCAWRLSDRPRTFYRQTDLDITSGEVRDRVYAWFLPLKSRIRETAFSRELRRLKIELPARRTWEALSLEGRGLPEILCAHGPRTSGVFDRFLSVFAQTKTPDEQRRVILEKLLTSMRTEEAWVAQEQAELLLAEFGEKHGLKLFDEDYLKQLKKSRGRVVRPQAVPVPAAGSARKRRPTRPRTADGRLPDLGQCTRLEVRYAPSLMQYFFSSETPTYLSPEELQQVQLPTIVEVNDPEFIKVLADRMRGGRQVEGITGVVPVDRTMDFTCHRGQEHVLTFTRLQGYLLAEDAGCFEFGQAWEDTEYVPPTIGPFLVRAQCASYLSRLHNWLRLSLRIKRPFPSIDTWCDAAHEDLQAEGRPEEEIREFFRCPGGSLGQSHYAMNPNCRPDSPEDLVFLFESRPGWNQHGGPEMFTLDNHDPRGGLVLLKDGTVKFIRSAEELQRLRWK